jgi:hypothetical protein
MEDYNTATLPHKKYVCIYCVWENFENWIFSMLKNARPLVRVHTKAFPHVASNDSEVQTPKPNILWAHVA